MTDNEKIITRFYDAFQQLNFTVMQDCYSEDAVFSDPGFGLLPPGTVHDMWEMLCTRAKNFSLTYSNIQLLDDEYATCNWIANYTFSKTGRLVENRVKAHLRIQNGKITEHTDEFDPWKWSRQALGFSGWLLGWSSFFRTRVQRNAVRGLSDFIREKEKK
jgi:ketosteroid isomerase-like protein